MIRTPPSDELPDAPRHAARASSTRSSTSPRRSAIAVERVLFQVNTRTAMSVGQASGLALALAGRAGIPVVHYSPNEVKLAVAGDGGADKARGAADGDAAPAAGASCPSPPDAADALALALCHWWRGAARGAGRGRRRRGRRSSTARSRPRWRRPRSPKEERAVIGSVRGTVLERTRHRRGAGRGRRRRLPGARARSARCRRSHPGDAAFLFTHLHVREDAMVLYGFPTRDERDTFEVLIGATGVGPKLALAMLSVHSPAALRRALLDDDLAALTLVPGVGKRTAQRLLVELKARLDVPELDLAEPGGATRRRAPRCARRSPASATRPTRCATSSAQLPDDGSVEDLLREALKLLAVTHA